MTFEAELRELPEGLGPSPGRGKQTFHQPGGGTWSSNDSGDLRVRREQRLRERVVEREHPRNAITTAWLTARPTPSAPPDRQSSLCNSRRSAMIAPKIVVFTTEPHKSVVDALLKNEAQNGPSGAC